MPKESSTGPERMEPIGPVLAVIGCTVGLVLLIGGAGAALVAGIRAASGDAEGVDLGLLIAGGLFAALVAYVGLGTVLHHWDVRRATLRLEAAGVGASAEVTGVGPEDTTADGGSRLIWIRVRVSGTGFPPFEASFPRPYGAAEATVGAEIEVVVDLVGNTFRL
ncbi:hypothetical protein OG978_14520 [Streptomyces sp. NBC_01591]|uniref:hypothetical protein n=1 Tax=Streptomyces sp. NBC_01591 TaxID=2975888 RepID=UPI002DDA80BC|nr:hypothetical protein [Streptomyces sp. NBC_01591]WSD68512.1 hypothetical protein OG978_14520 [Streptomyces sp. NBC_01591]